VIPAVIAAGVFLFNDRQYAIVSAAAAILACAPFFLAFEKKQARSRELTVVAVMVALSVAGRLIFAPVPGFKPVTAVVIITALCFGAEAGFLTGSMTAVISNMFFGQGPWTPFQMFGWGLLGFFIGLFHKRKIVKTYPFLAAEGIIGGVVYSLLMDVWTVLAFDGGFSMPPYFAAVAAGLPFMAVYAVSNAVFLLILYKPISNKLERIKKKYMLFDYAPGAADIITEPNITNITDMTIEPNITNVTVESNTPNMTIESNTTTEPNTANMINITVEPNTANLSIRPNAITEPHTASITVSPETQPKETKNTENDGENTK
jgi:uncharacterized membrane protein